MSKATGSKAGKAKSKTASKLAPAAAKKVALAKHVKSAVKNAKASKSKTSAPAAKTALKKSSVKTPAKVQPKSAAAKPATTKAAPPVKTVAGAKSGQKSDLKSDLKSGPKSDPKSGQPASAPRAIATAKPAPQVKSEGIPKKMVARPKPVNVVLPPDYRPSDNEPFMNDLHRAYFRKRLLDWKDDILRQTRETLAILHEDSTQHADLADRATSETDRATELRTRDRQRKLISKIDAAIARIDDGSYGYCEDTGEPIGLKRLDARPIATLSVEAQERHERREKVYREE